jgi:hypothetical protein
LGARLEGSPRATRRTRAAFETPHNAKLLMTDVAGIRDCHQDAEVDDLALGRLASLCTVSDGIGTVTVKACQPVSVPLLCNSCAHNMSVPASVPASNTVVATSAGDTSISWPPV